MASKPISRAAQKELAAGDYYLALVPEESFSCDDYGDPDHYVHEIAGDVTLCGYSGKTLAQIGSFSVIQVDVEGAMSQRVSVFDVFDTRHDTYVFFEALYDALGFKPKVLKALDCEDEVVPWGILILNRLSIEPAFRGNRFGLEALKCLVQRYRMGAGLIAMKPFPLQFEGDDTAADLQGFKGGISACTAKLRRYYSQLGFKRIPGTPFMALPTIYQLGNVTLKEGKRLGLRPTQAAAPLLSAGR